MRRMISQKEQQFIKAMKEVVAHESSTNTTEFGGNVYVDGNIEANGVGAELSNAMIEALIGHFVRVIDAPSSTTLTEEQVDQITKGVFVNGSFLGVDSPILGSATFYGGSESRDYAKGFVFGGGALIGAYLITMATKTIVMSSATSPSVQLQSISAFNGKTIPSYPSSTGTFTLKCVNGVLTWIAD